MRVLILIVFVGLLFCGQSLAGEVQIVDAKAVQQGDAWSFSVTLKHADSGWEHYVDAWRVVSATGNILGVRTLLESVGLYGPKRKVGCLSPDFSSFEGSYP